MQTFILFASGSTRCFISGTDIYWLGAAKKLNPSISATNVEIGFIYELEDLSIK